MVKNVMLVENLEYIYVHIYNSGAEISTSQVFYKYPAIQNAMQYANNREITYECGITVTATYNSSPAARPRCC
jgi:hypothetical protein